MSTLTTHARTWLLVAGLTALLLAIGTGLGGGFLVIAVILALVMNVGGYWFSDRVALKLSRAQPLPPEQAPGLHQAVTDLSQRAGVPTPQLYLIPSDQPNAFATGRNPQHAAIAVTEGLIRHLPADQVQGVIAHELAHIKNRDILVSSIAATIAAAISGIATFLQFSWLFGGEDDESPLGLVGTIAAIIFAPMAAMLLQLAVSRQREYLADATAAELLGTPRPLMNALGTLERGTQLVPMQVQPATASLYIANPLRGGQGMTSLFSTHPPMEERIRRLAALDHAASPVFA
jgi:heat shock protein HtpX